ncbi:hypothetical protein [Pelagovum pacificum]|uniref:PH domain-containing protein n=1 Tax=Pelagovum pacificum TaxID=2588711 RepID=A0A5C5GGQ2_9RHOB|nr:hypothetical protein [Pelagovum pacificum]QQA43677.1 hypothetical protein I8N54_03620 [Pelagovum pacificum]TNY33189.1 hypothetical protein FHY64_07910 [Pelagovum pacificum]
MTTDRAEELFRLQASPPRRAFAVGVLYVLGALLAYLAFAAPAAAGYRIALVLCGAVTMWAGERMRQGTKEAVVLTTDGLVESTGRVIAPLDRIVKVDRGTFAFRPSNGFLVTLDSPMERAWVPGLWWRVGRRIGLGGVTSGGQSKAMADQLALMVADLSTERR